MNFVTPQDYRDRYGDDHALKLTNLDNPEATIINLALLQKRCDEADNLIEAYAPELTSVPPILVQVGAQLVNRALHIFDPPEGVLAEYSEAMKILRDIAAGRITLQTTAGAVTDAGVSFAVPDTVFSNQALYDFRNPQLYP